MNENLKIRWYPIRVTYGREIKFQDYLNHKHIESFIPMQYKSVVKEGKKKRVLLPAVNNLCFVHTTKKVLDEIRAGLFESMPVHYMWDRVTLMPIYVQDKAMADFIKISSSYEDDLIYISEVSPLLRAGQKVLINSGPFEGVEGKVVRIKKMRRVMVELPGMMAVASTYIRPEFLTPVVDK